MHNTPSLYVYDSELLLSHIHTHVSTDATSMPILSLSLTETQASYSTMHHQIKTGLTKSKFEKAIKAEVQQVLGITNIWD